MIVLGIETSCDETAAALVEETGDAARPWRLRVERRRVAGEIHREWGGVVPELSARQHIRDICGVVERALLDGGTRALRRHRGDAAGRASSGRCSSACRSPSRSPGRVGCRSFPCTISPATSNRWCSKTARCPLPAVVLVVSGGHTSLYLRAGARDLRAARPHARRCGRRGVRQGGQAARARISRRAGDRPSGRARATTARSPFPKTRLTHADRNAPASARPPRLQLQRTQDVGAAARDRAARGARPAATRARCRTTRSATSAPASSASSSRRCSIGCSTRRAGTARAASALPAACRPTAGCARTPCARRGARPAGVHSEPGAVDRQCGDDCGRRAARLSRRHDRWLGSERGCVADADVAGRSLP